LSVPASLKDSKHCLASKILIQLPKHRCPASFKASYNFQG